MLTLVQSFLCDYNSPRFAGAIADWRFEFPPTESSILGTPPDFVFLEPVFRKSWLELVAFPKIPLGAFPLPRFPFLLAPLPSFFFSLIREKDLRAVMFDQFLSVQSKSPSAKLVS